MSDIIHKYEELDDHNVPLCRKVFNFPIPGKGDIDWEKVTCEECKKMKRGL